MLSSVNSRFESLPARPPTPPRDTAEDIQNALTFLREDIDTVDEISSSQLQRPSTDTPPSSSPLAPQRSEILQAAKRVEFQPIPTYHQPLESGILSSPRNDSHTPRLPSRFLRPAKSILKLSNSPLPPTPDEQERQLGSLSLAEPESFVKMLPSVMRQLAASSRHSRLDAYLALNGALTAYDGIPDHNAMSAQIDTIVLFLNRDLAARDDSGNLDVNMIAQALKLAARIIVDEELSKSVDHEFRIFLIERSISAFEQDAMPKQIVKSYLQLLAYQRFSSSVVTSSRADKLVSALQTIENRCSGNSVVAARLVIYRRLIDQASSTMYTRMRDWLENVLHGVLSDINETRIRAFEVCTYAGLVFGTKGSAANVLQQLFERETEDGSSYFEYFRLCVAGMLEKPDTKALVPQIWSAVILFYRSRKPPLERWSGFKYWLMIIEKCLNSSDLTVRYQANVAWKKLALTVRPDSTTSRPMLNILSIPIQRGFLKTGSDRASKQARQFALESYYNLLHYALRPGLSAAEICTAWDMFIDEPLSNMIKASSKGRMIACRVLHGLLTPNSGAWNSAAALEEEAIEPKDLPRLDPRWVRTNLSKILPMVESVVKPTVSLSQEAFATAECVWQALLQGVAEAGSQEVRTSNELKDALAQLLNTLCRIWCSCSVGVDNIDRSTIVDRLSRIIVMACQHIGPSHFTEGVLTLDNAGVATPLTVDRPARSDRYVLSPLAIILTTLCKAGATVATREAAASIASELLELVCATKATTTAKMQLLATTWAAATSSNETRGQMDGSISVWGEVVRTATNILQNSPRGETNHATIVAQQLADGRAILISGFSLMGTSSAAAIPFADLTTALLDIAEATAGEAGPALAVIEPIACALVKDGLGTDIGGHLELILAMLHGSQWPSSRQAIDVAQNFAPDSTNQRNLLTLDPYDDFYSLLNEVMVTYHHTREDAVVSFSIAEILPGLLAFLASCPASLLPRTTHRLGEALTVWVQGFGGKVITGFHEDYTQHVSSFWTDLLTLLQKTLQKGINSITMLEPLLVAGFTSPIRAIADNTVEFWNTTYGQELRLDYPERLQNVLLSLQRFAHLDLPTFPAQAEEAVYVDLPAFIDKTPEKERLSTAGVSQENNAESAVVSHDPVQDEVVPETAIPQVSNSTSNEYACELRPRHDDSQALFIPIEPSSPISIEESQLLTEHQREVKDRQISDAQMFPDMSSSPTGQSTIRQKMVSRRLNFSSTSPQREHTEAELPAVAFNTDIREDDLCSSPTPRGSQAEDGLAQELIEEAEEDQDELPSSPPRALVFENEEVSRLDDGGEVAKNDDDIPTDAEELVQVQLEPAEPAVPAKPGEEDHLSDSILPDEQLQLEAEAAELRQSQSQEQSQSQGRQMRGPSRSTKNTRRCAKPVDLEAAASDEELQLEAEAAEVRQHQGQSQGRQVKGRSRSTKIAWRCERAVDLEAAASDEESTGAASEGSETRIEDSFAMHAESAKDHEAAPTDNGNEPNVRTTRKRKRAVSSSASAKKSRHEPMEYLYPLAGEEDIGEEIIVASSQISSSPASRPFDEGSTFALGQAETAQEDRIQESQPRATSKGKRGRPKRNSTPISIPAAAGAASRLKRNSSATDNEEYAVERSSSIDVSATRKARKQRSNDQVSSTRILRSSQQGPEVKAKTTREVVEVLLPQPTASEERPEEFKGLTEDTTSQAIEAGEQESVASQSSIFSASGIMERLKEVLEGCKRAVLKPTEERRIDDALFEIRVATREAARRGNDS